MPNRPRARFQDIAIIEIHPPPPSTAPTSKKKECLLCKVAYVAIGTVALVAIGYAAGVNQGIFDQCCSALSDCCALRLDFDFELDAGAISVRD